MDAGNITAKVTLDLEGFKNGISKVESMTSKLAGGIGNVLGGVTAAVGAAVGAAAAGIGSIVKDSVEAFGEFEQLAGGAQKIFDDIDYNKIALDASNAWQTMNLSASQYLSMINNVGASFAATMGDQKGYETAKTGMQAIADYASGTGRNVEELNQKFAMITRAASSYQSIADQFSGILPATSKAFLEQAQSAGILSTKYKDLTKVPIAEYQEAVSKMLEKGVADLNLTGNTMEETTRTITGSLAGLKAAWQNLITGLADESANLGPLIDTVVNQAEVALRNLIPVVENALYGVGELIVRLAPVISERLPELLSQLVPMFLDAAISIVNALVVELPDLVKTLGDAILTMIPSLVNAVIDSLDVLLTSVLPTVIDVAIELVLALGRGLVDNADRLVKAIVDLIFYAINAIINHLPEFIKLGFQIVLMIIEGILMAIPELLKSIGRLLGIVDDTKDHIEEKTKDLTSSLHESTRDTDKTLNKAATSVETHSKSISNSVKDMEKSYSSAFDGMKNSNTEFDKSIEKTGNNWENTFEAMIRTSEGFERSTTNMGELVKNQEVKVYDSNNRVIGSFNATTMTVQSKLLTISGDAAQAEQRIQSAMNSVASEANTAASTVESAVNRMNTALGSLSSAELLIGHRAGGGPVQAGVPYMTGELGRELFVPSTNGYIIDHNDTEELLDNYSDSKEGIVININGDIYDDERSMRRKLKNAILGVMQEQVAYG